MLEEPSTEPAGNPRKPPKGQVTRLLAEWNGGRDALDQLAPIVYAELRHLAGRFLKDERIGHTLQPTALVHEAYIRLAGQERTAWQNRAHFFGVAAQIMRRILVDYARARHTGKRG